MKLHQNHLASYRSHLQNIESQLEQNRLSAENEIKLKRQQLLLEIERLFDIAMKDIEIQSKTKGDLIREKMAEHEDQRRRAD